MVNLIARKAVLMAAAVSFLAGCSKSSSSYSLLSDAADYQQQAILIPKKIDVLWVIDNSGSMAPYQQDLADNFQSFIQRFETSNFDFHMAVTTTEAWQAAPNSEFGMGLTQKAEFRPGLGVYVMDKYTSNLGGVFGAAVKQGINGSGDERAFHSFRATLESSINNQHNFRRDDAFLAVIIVTDEEDYSRSSGSMDNPSNPGLHPVQDYVTFLRDYTQSTDTMKNYSVSAIYVPTRTNPGCTLHSAAQAGNRVGELATLTGGVKASLCSNFGQSLELISDSIIQLSAVFQLQREPVESTITVKVNGVVVPKSLVNGWTYNAADLTIHFHGDAIPSADANIQIDFYPKSIKL
ncbi:hypothetical protein BDW_05045 [Bdellovibrio bacteriovorus W]|nr:hypothetical protein BDW_05045 [Bdellovibrio bacteriovorus W]